MQRLVAVYDEGCHPALRRGGRSGRGGAATPDDGDPFPRLLELMQDLQAYGPPPRELLAQLAPGLEVTPDGLPLLLPLAGAAGGGGGGCDPALSAAVPLGGCAVM